MQDIQKEDKQEYLRKRAVALRAAVFFNGNIGGKNGKVCFLKDFISCERSSQFLLYDTLILINFS